MLEHYLRTAKALDIDVDKIWSDMARALVRDEITREQRKKMRKEIGCDISKRTYFRCKKKVEETKRQRLYRIAKPNLVHSV